MAASFSSLTETHINRKRNSSWMIRRQENTHGSSPISTSTGFQYDVFLSFRGADTRHTFTSFLYKELMDAGLQVFMDEEKLRVGEDIHPNLMEAIEKSRLSIPIFSPNYASSKSCLHEMAKINECNSTRGQIVLPIFYGIEPSDVRNQTGPFELSFQEHQEKRVDSQVVNKWKQALHGIGFLKGYHVCGSQAKLVSRIVSEVTQLLKTYEVRFDDDYLVGTEQPVHKVVEMLQIYSSDVQIFGICGMSGIGKTTLAKVVYNKVYQHFDGCSFISRNPESGLCCLQNQFITQLLRKKYECNSFEENIKFISHRFQNTRVLIVLDNVESLAHFKAFVGDVKCFGPGSRIILTTQMPEDLVEAKIHQWYTVKPLDETHALQLFKWHAFGKDSPEGEYIHLSAEIASRTGGIPSIIRFVGCQLSAHRNKDQQIWKEILLQLRKGGHERLEKLLKMSYENLDEYQRQIYLDIACFLTGESNAIAYYMWDDCEFFPALSVRKLIHMSLLKIGEEDELLMSNAVRAFGRKLVSEEDSDPRMRSRLWIHNEGLNVLQGKKGTDRIKAICLQFDNDKYLIEGHSRGHQHWAAASLNPATHSFPFEILDLPNFAGLSKLRFLRLHKAKTRRFINLLPELRWLNWEYCPEISEEVQRLCLENLVILDMSRSNVKQEWGGWELITKKAEKLKVILLAQCNRLHGSPIFPPHRQLERLNFEDCSRLRRISIPSGTIKTLVYLNLKGCSDLTELPQGLSSMVALRTLIVDGTSIKKLSAGSKMKNLKVLSACGCKDLEIIDNSIGDLKSLTSLALDDTAIEELPDSICKLTKLRTLSLRNCTEFSKLPSCVGDLTSLVKMNLSFTLVAALPPSVERLKSLQVLLMEGTYLGEFPNAVTNVKNLQKIDFSDCRCMKGEIPAGINNLSSLKTLMLSATKISGLPTDTSGLSQLQDLDLHMCENLQDLPSLPSSLTSLSMGSQEMCSIPDLSYMKNLLELHLADNSGDHPELLTNGRALESWSASSFLCITNLSNLEVLELHISKVLNLPDDFSGLKKLGKLVLSCQHLKCLPCLPSSLTTLCLQYCKSLSASVDLSHLASLSNLEIVHCAVKSINLTDLSELLHLKISDCCLEKIIGIEGLSCLEEFGMSNCPQFPRDDLKMLKDHGVKVLLEGLEFLANMSWM